MQSLQLAKRLTLDRLEPSYEFSIKETLGIGTPEGPDHNQLYNGKR